MKTTNMRFWHYTPSIFLPQILESGKINLDAQSRSFGEKPATWISTNPEWEYTVMKSIIDGSGNEIMLSKDELNQRLGLGRIEIKPSLSFISWDKFGSTSGINKKLWIGMTKLGIEKGANPNEWYASYIPLIKRYFLSVEMNIDGKWVACKDWNMINQFIKEGMESNRKFFKNKRYGLFRRVA